MQYTTYIQKLVLTYLQTSPVRKVWVLIEIAILGILLYAHNALTLPSDLSIVENLIDLGIIYLGARLVFELVQIPFVAAYRRRNGLERGERDNFIIGTNALVSVFSILAMGISVFFVFNIQLQEFLTSLSLFAVAIVWITNDYIRNFIDSFVLMFSSDLRIGEYIQVDENTKGIIQDITFRATKIKTDDGNVLFVPNTKLVHGEVTNYSKTKFKRIAIAFTMPRNKLSDVIAFEEALRTALCDAFPELITKEKVSLRTLDIESADVHFSLDVAISTYSFSIEQRIRKWFAAHILQKEV